MNARQQLQLPHPSHLNEGHTAQVYATELRGSCLVSGSADQTLRIWNVETQRLVRGPLVGHEGSVICLQFDDSANQDVIISGGKDGSFIAWQFTTGNIVKRLANAHEDTILSLAFDDRVLVTGGRDSKIKLWTRCPISHPATELPEYIRSNLVDVGAGLAEYTHLATLRGSGAPVNSVCLHGTSMISGHGDGSIAVWDLSNGQRVHNIATPRGIADVKYNGRFVFVGSTDNTCRVFDSQLNTELACLDGHRNLPRSLCIVPGEGYGTNDFVTGGYDGTIRYWKHLDGNRWECQNVLHVDGFHDSDSEMAGGPVSTINGQYSTRVFDIQIDSTRLVAAGHGPLIRIWEIS